MVGQLEMCVKAFKTLWKRDVVNFLGIDKKTYAVRSQRLLRDQNELFPYCLCSLCCLRTSHKAPSVRVQNLEPRIEGLFVVTRIAVALNSVWSQCSWREDVIFKLLHSECRMNLLRICKESC